MNLEEWIALISLVATIVGGFAGALYNGLRKRLDTLEKAMTDLQKNAASFATTQNVTSSIDRLRDQLLDQQARSEDRVVAAMRDFKGYLDTRLGDMLEKVK